MHPLLSRLPRLQSLTVFECAARVGSFTSAAAELGMTQSGVSRQIGALERTIRQPLFDRSGNRVELNPDGATLLASIQAAFDLIDRGLDQIANPEPTFVLAANPGYAQRFLIPYRDALQAVLGEADLRLRLFDRDGELVDGDFDAAIHLSLSKGVAAGSRHLFDEVVVPVASPDYAEAYGLDAATTPSFLQRMELLHLDGRERQWMGWREWFASHDLHWSPERAAMSYNNHALVVEDALAGRGIALAWHGLVDAALDTGLLVAVGPSIARPDYGCHLIPGSGVDLGTFERLSSWLVGHVA